MSYVTLVEFRTVGVPKPKGSLDVVTASHVREAVKGSKDWRKMMVRAARAAHDRPGPWSGPVTVAALFRMPTPDVIRNGAGAADLDKLVRNLLDALGSCGRGCDLDAEGNCPVHARIYVDDVQVIRLVVDKVACSGGVDPGVAVVVSGQQP